MPNSRGFEPTRSSTQVVGGRVAAQIVDIVIQFLLAVAMVVGLVVLFPPTTRSAIQGYTYLSVLTLPLYGTILEGLWGGKTVGKAIFGVRVVDEAGEAPTLWQAFVRNLPAVILFGWIPSLVALAAMASSDLRQRLFDMAASTYVVESTPHRQVSDPTDDSTRGDEDFSWDGLERDSFG